MIYVGVFAALGVVGAATWVLTEYAPRRRAHTKARENAERVHYIDLSRGDS
jgi:hypothetical protein